MPENMFHHGEYLCEVDKTTGIATIVNWGARDLGAGFAQGRTFTQFMRVSINDMVWWTAPPGDEVPSGYTGTLYGICSVQDALLYIDINTGFARRTSSIENFGWHTPDGYHYIGGGAAVGYTGTRLYMCGIAQYSVEDGHPRMAELFDITGDMITIFQIGGNPIDLGESEEGTVRGEVGNL